MAEVVILSVALLSFAGLVVALVREVRRDGMGPRRQSADWAEGTTLPIARSTRRGL